MRRQGSDSSENLNRGEQLEREVSLLLFQSKETSEFSQIGAGSQHLCDVSKGNAAAQSNAGDLATTLENFGSVTGLVSQRN